jgi:hypothetical protein
MNWMVSLRTKVRKGVRTSDTWLFPIAPDRKDMPSPVPP